MPLDESYHQNRNKNNVNISQRNNSLTSRRRIPFDTNSNRLTSSTEMKRTNDRNSSYLKAKNRQEIFLNKSSSSSFVQEEEEEEDEQVKTLDETLKENQLDEDFDPRKNFSMENRHSTINGNSKSNGRFSGTMIEELLESNMDLKKELRDIRRQIKQRQTTSNKPHRDQRISSSTTRSNYRKINSQIDERHDCSLVPGDDESPTTLSKLKQYKNEAQIYKQQLDACQETIVQLRRTIDTMEKNLEQLRNSQRRQNSNLSNQQENGPTNHSDHRFIHELFHLCIKHLPRSSKSSTIVPSHNDMKTFIRQSFTEFVKSSSSSNSKISANHQNESNHFVCKCPERVKTEHRPSHQYALTIVEQCQSLFDVTCYTQLPTALNEVYYRYGELLNFKRSIASSLGVTASSRSTSCPKLIRTLQQMIDDAKSNELITFKRMAKINDMNEAVSKIRSYDEFVPYYHKFIEQMANLLEVSKGDEIMPAIKTLKLLAHSDSHRDNSIISQPVSQALTRTSSMNIYRTSHDDDLIEKYPFVSKSMQFSSSRTTIEPSIDSRLDFSEKTNENSESTVRPNARTDS